MMGGPGMQCPRETHGQLLVARRRSHSWAERIWPMSAPVDDRRRCAIYSCRKEVRCAIKRNPAQWYLFNTGVWFSIGIKEKDIFVILLCLSTLKALHNIQIKSIFMCICLFFLYINEHIYIFTGIHKCDMYKLWYVQSIDQYHRFAFSVTNFHQR